MGLRLLLLFAILSGFALFGWTAATWRKDAQIATIKNEHATELAAATSQALALQQERDAARSTLAAKLSTVDAEGVRALKKAQNETDRLRTCVRNGTCGVRVEATCPPASGSVLPSTATNSGVDSGAGARLTPEAEQDYFNLRTDIKRVQTKLSACQAAAANLTGQKLLSVE